MNLTFIIFDSFKLCESWRQRQLHIIQMHNYKGIIRRENDNTPTKSSWEHRQNPQQREYNRQYQKEARYDTRNDIRNETRNETRNDIRNDSRYQPKYQRSQLSYYQSQSSRVYYDHEERPPKSQQGQLLDDKYFYNNLLPVVLRSSDNEHEQRLRVVIQGKVEKGQHQLQMYLSEDSNPKFLWMFAVKEVDFLTLKNSQKLKVSYAGFPEMLENCIKDCEESENRSNFLVLETRKGEGRLQFLESGKYKTTCHLQLAFKQPSDEELKDHMAAKLLAASAEIQQNRVSMRGMENVLGERMRQLQQMNSELNALRAQRDKMKDEFSLQLTQKRTEHEASKLNQISKAKREAENELKELRQRLTAQIQSLSKQKTDLTTRLAQSRERVSVLQGIERDQKMQIARLQQESSKSSREAEAMRAQNRELSERRFQNEKTITELSCRIDSLRMQLQDKKTIINSTVQLKQTNNSQISSLEQLASDQKKQLLKAEQKIAQLESELAKTTTNSAELLEKLARQKEKLQERGQIIKEQEKELKELTKNEAVLQRQNERLTYEKDDRENKVKALQDQLDKLQKRFQEEQAMVAYLQKNLNERPGLRNNYYPPPTTSYTPSYINRDPSQLSTHSNVASSRITTSQPRTDKYEPNIKRYEQRSKSPLQSRLPQQKQPEDEEQYSEKPSKFEKPIPVKFKMSQPRE